MFKTGRRFEKWKKKIEIKFLVFKINTSQKDMFLKLLSLRVMKLYDKSALMDISQWFVAL